MTKIPLFRFGGWLNSYDGAFNQPSSYVGLQYVQKNPDLPPLEGLRKYIEDQEKLRKEHEAYRKAASPDDEAFKKLMGDAVGKGLTGQLDELSGMYNQWKQKFHSSFKGDDVFSDDAKALLGEMNSILGPSMLNRLKQNQDLFNEQKEIVKSEKIGASVWTDGEKVLVRDLATGKVHDVGLDMYSQILNDPEASKQYRALDNRQALDWKDKNWSINDDDRIIIGNMMSMDSLNKFIDDVFKNIGHTSNSNVSDQFRNIGSYLESIGIDTENGNVIQQINQKFKNNSAQLAEAQSRIYNVLPQEAKNAMISQMISMGRDPLGSTEIETKEGTQKVSNMAMFMSDIIGSATRSKLVDERETGNNFSFMPSGSGNGKNGIMLDQLALMLMDPEQYPNSERIKIESPDILQKRQQIDAFAIPLRGDIVRERFPDLQKLNVVTQGKRVLINGEKVMVGTSADPNNPKTWVELPVNESYIVPLQETVMRNGQIVTDEQGNPKKETKYYVQRQALVNKSTLQSLDKELGGGLIDIPVWAGAKGLNSMAYKVEDVNLSDALKSSGATEKEIEAGKSAFSSAWLMLQGDDVHRITYYEPFGELDVNLDTSKPVQREITNAVGQQFLNEALKNQQRMNQAKDQKSNLTVKK